MLRLLTLTAGVLFAGLLMGLWLFAHEDRRTPLSWTVYFAAEVLLLVAIGLLSAASTTLVSGDDFSKTAFQQLGHYVWAIAFAIAWGLYWRRSRRVRNTYGYVGWRWPPRVGEPEHWHGGETEIA